jgi:molecular chaperone GrpE
VTSTSEALGPEHDDATHSIDDAVSPGDATPDVQGGSPESLNVTLEEGTPDERSDVERERDEYLDALRRLQADFENYKKRVGRQFEELSARGVTALVDKLLPVLDALDLAEAHLLAETSADGTMAADTKALVQARALLVDTLQKEGLEPVGVAGQSFDPNVHDAVAHVDGDDGPIIDEVLRSGYQWRGQVLRPAMVRVRG